MRQVIQAAEEQLWIGHLLSKNILEKVELPSVGFPKTGGLTL